MSQKISNWFTEANAHIDAAQVSDEDIRADADFKDYEMQYASEGEDWLDKHREQMVSNIKNNARGELAIIARFNKDASPATLKFVFSDTVAKLSENSSPGWTVRNRIAREALEHLLLQPA